MRDTPLFLLQQMLHGLPERTLGNHSIFINYQKFITLEGCVIYEYMLTYARLAGLFRRFN